MRMRLEHGDTIMINGKVMDEMLDGAMTFIHPQEIVNLNIGNKEKIDEKETITGRDNYRAGDEAEGCDPTKD